MRKLSLASNQRAVGLNCYELHRFCTRTHPLLLVQASHGMPWRDLHAQLQAGHLSWRVARPAAAAGGCSGLWEHVAHCDASKAEAVRLGACNMRSINGFQGFAHGVDLVLAKQPESGVQAARHRLHITFQLPVDLFVHVCHVACSCAALARHHMHVSKDDSLLVVSLVEVGHHNRCHKLAAPGPSETDRCRQPWADTPCAGLVAPLPRQARCQSA